MTAFARMDSAQTKQGYLCSSTASPGPRQQCERTSAPQARRDDRMSDNTVQTICTSGAIDPTNSIVLQSLPNSFRTVRCPAAFLVRHASRPGPGLTILGSSCCARTLTRSLLLVRLPLHSRHSTRTVSPPVTAVNCACCGCASLSFSVACVLLQYQCPHSLKFVHDNPLSTHIACAFKSQQLRHHEDKLSRRRIRPTGSQYPGDCIQ